MASLMFHPLYVNQDTQDADDYRYMSFTYHAAVAGALGSNSYTIKAVAGGTCGSTASVTIVVASNNTASISPAASAGSIG